MKQTNYHTHTARCKHAEDTDEEYVLAAIEGGYEIFGFADHCPWPYASGYVSNIRMLVSELDGYLDSIRKLKERYADRIELHVGVECEYYPEYLSWLEKMLVQKHVEYALLGNHHNLTDEGGFYFGLSSKPEHIRLYTERTIAGMKTGLFSYLAHPDVVMRGYPVFDEACEEMAYRLCETANEMNMPLEYNLMGNEYKKNGRPEWKGIGYPDDHFWKIAAKMNCTAIIGLDSHKAAHVRQGKTDYPEAVRYLNSLGIHRIDQIPLR